MATERELELLDDYLANRLGATEKSSFEQKLQSDPDLKNELKFQQKLVKGIKDIRVAELKAMLNNTPVPAGQGGTSTIAKFALGGAVAGLIATGIYFYSAKTEEDKFVAEQPSSPIIDTAEKDQSTKKSTPEPDSNKTSDKNSPPAQEDTEVRKQTTDKTEDGTLAIRKPSLDVYDPSAETEEANSTDVEEPAGERLSETSEGAPAIAVEIDKNDKQYQFHYQFKNGKLFLYGPFESNLYEIMEFFSNDKRTVFLYYKDGYYLLEERNAGINPLKAITETKLLQKLKEYRKR